MDMTTVPCSRCGADTPTIALVAARFPGAVRCDACSGPVDHEPPVSRTDLFLRHRVPADAREASLDRISNDLLRRVLRTFASSWPDVPSPKQGGPMRAIPIIGVTGAGKTCAVWATLIEMVRTRKLTPDQIVTGTEQDLLVPASKVSDYQSANTKGTWRSIVPHTTKVVFVDEVGMALYSSPQVRTAVWLGLLSRVEKLGACLFLTSNHSLPEVYELVGAAAASRLSGMTGMPTDFPGWQTGTTDWRTGINRAR